MTVERIDAVTGEVVELTEAEARPPHRAHPYAARIASRPPGPTSPRRSPRRTSAAPTLPFSYGVVRVRRGRVEAVRGSRG